MVRPMNKQDIPRLLEILNLEKRMSYRPVLENDIDVTHDMQAINLTPTQRPIPYDIPSIYTYDDGVVKGMISWKRQGTKVKIRGVYVDPMYQHEHIGTTMMTGFMNSMMGQDIKRIVLWVLEENIGAIRFFEQFGFQYTGEREYVKKADCYLMKYVKMM